MPAADVAKSWKWARLENFWSQTFSIQEDEAIQRLSSFVPEEEENNKTQDDERINDKS